MFDKNICKKLCNRTEKITHEICFCVIINHLFETLFSFFARHIVRSYESTHVKEKNFSFYFRFIMLTKSVCLVWHKQTSRAHSFIIYELLIWTPFAFFTWFFFFKSQILLVEYGNDDSLKSSFQKKFSRWMKISRLSIYTYMYLLETKKNTVVFTRFFFWLCIARVCIGNDVDMWMKAYIMWIDVFFSIAIFIDACDCDDTQIRDHFFQFSIMTWFNEGAQRI